MKRWFRNLIGELFGFYEAESNMLFAVSNLTSFVFENAAMPDKSGKTEDPYNSDEVSDMWLKYHKLTDEIYRSRMKR